MPLPALHLPEWPCVCRGAAVVIRCEKLSSHNLGTEQGARGGKTSENRRASLLNYKIIVPKPFSISWGEVGGGGAWLRSPPPRRVDQKLRGGGGGPLVLDASCLLKLSRGVCFHSFRSSQTSYTHTDTHTHTETHLFPGKRISSDS